MKKDDILAREDEIITAYMEKFNVTKLPIFIMMQSMEDYLNELQNAIDTNTPVDDDNREDYDVID